MIQKRSFLVLLFVPLASLGWSLPKLSLDPSQQNQNISEAWYDNMTSLSNMGQEGTEDGAKRDNFDPNDKIHGLDDIVGGVPEEVKYVVDCLKNPEKYRQAGVKISNAYLFVGPPGTGKTSIARALAQEVGGGMVTRSGSDFIEIYVGNGAKRVREAFAEARRLAARMRKKVFLFIDEIDAIGKRGDGQNNSEVQQTINALLKEMSGIENDNSVIVVAATNFVENVDPALMRSGRFTVIEIPVPNKEQRELILKHYCNNKTLAADVDLNKIADHTNNFTPADLEELCNHVATYALSEKAAAITTNHFIRGIKAIWHDRKNQGEKNVNINLNALDMAFQEDKSEVANMGLGFHGLAGDIEPEILGVLHYLQSPEDYKHYGVKEPKGILMVGPPGTGKTSLARALAQEAGCEFISVKGSEFVEIYVGTGAKRVRELFEKARKKAAGNEHKKTIIFIDEIDSIGSRDVGSNHQEARQTVAELLGQMEGFEEDDSIMVIAATNCPETLDKALLRPGRFDVTIEIGLPGVEKRTSILKHYCKNKPMDRSVSYAEIAKQTEGFSPADLKNLVNEAAKAAMFSSAGKTITKAHFATALKKLGVQQQLKTENKLNGYLPPYLQE